MSDEAQALPPRFLGSLLSSLCSLAPAKSGVSRDFAVKNEQLHTCVKSSLAIGSLTALFCLQTFATSPGGGKGFTSFDQALAEAKRVAEKDPGKHYDGEFAKTIAPRLGDIVNDCTKDLGPRVNFQVVFVFAANGRVEQIFTPAGQPAATCVGEKLRDVKLPPPPQPDWPVQLSINTSPDYAPTIVGTAMKEMEKGIWEVSATVSRGMSMRVQGLIAGEDSDLTLVPEDRNAVRQIAIKDQIWSSFDGSKTWKLEPTASAHELSRRLYAFVHEPIRYQTQMPEFQMVGKESHEGENWLHFRRETSGKNTGREQRMDYWIATGQGDGSLATVRRYEGPVTEKGHEHEPLHCVATYQPAKTNATIAPPPDVTPSVGPEKQQSITSIPGQTVTLLDGKLKIDIPADFTREKDGADEKSLAKFSGPKGAWGKVLRGTHGLTPDELPAYLKKRVAEYSKGFNGRLKELHIEWLRKDIVNIGGRPWADWRFVPMAKGSKDYKRNPVYSRFLTTSYQGQLLEITFSTNLNTEPYLKEEIDRIMDSVHLEE